MAKTGFYLRNMNLTELLNRSINWFNAIKTGYDAPISEAVNILSALREFTGRKDPSDDTVHYVLGKLSKAFILITENFPDYEELSFNEVAFSAGFNSLEDAICIVTVYQAYSYKERSK